MCLIESYIPPTLDDILQQVYHSVVNKLRLISDMLSKVISAVSNGSEQCEKMNLQCFDKAC